VVFGGKRYRRPDVEIVKRAEHLLSMAVMSWSRSQGRVAIPSLWSARER
jgi:hypothetical protein